MLGTYLSCQRAGAEEVLQADAARACCAIQLAQLLSHPVLKGAAALNAQQATGECKAQLLQLLQYEFQVDSIIAIWSLSSLHRCSG